MRGQRQDTVVPTRQHLPLWSLLSPRSLRTLLGLLLKQPEGSSGEGLGPLSAGQSGRAAGNAGQREEPAETVPGGRWEEVTHTGCLAGASLSQSCVHGAAPTFRPLGRFRACPLLSCHCPLSLS